MDKLSSNSLKMLIIKKKIRDRGKEEYEEFTSINFQDSIYITIHTFSSLET